MPEENKPEDAKAAEPEAAEAKAAEPEAAEPKAADKKAAEPKAAGKKAADRKAADKKAVPPRPAAVEQKPILAGRLWIGLGLLAGFGLLANPVFNNWVSRKFAPPVDLRTDFSKWKVGNQATVRVTVITADSSRLSCAHSDVVEGAHCAFGKDRIMWPRGPETPADDNGPDLIQPYRTSPDNALILLSGLWAQPEVAMRLHREPPTGIQAKRLNRFDVTCTVKFTGKFDTVDLRWDVGANWQTERNAWVARAVSCQVNNT